MDNRFCSTAHLASARSQSYHSKRISTGEFYNEMKKIEWQGVFPAITTPFNEDLSVDHGFLAEHCKWLVNSGCKGLVAAGSLGEGATLSLEERDRVVETCVRAVGDRAYVVAGISSLTTAESVAMAQSAETIGCPGLMVLPPYVYVGDWREMQSHVSAVLSATGLSPMLYNNPIAYTTDFSPSRFMSFWIGIRICRRLRNRVRTYGVCRPYGRSQASPCRFCAAWTTRS
jgi:hypothetical protein